MSDLRVSVRQLAKSPGFTIAAVAVLTLGIGLNAAMFAVIHALVFAARPFAEPDRLVQLYVRDERTPDSYRLFSHPVYQELAGASAFAGVLAHNAMIVGIDDGGESRRALASMVSGNYFQVLGVPLAQGRGFTADESRPAANVPVVIASHAYWKRAGLDRDMLGRVIRVNERAFTVVGVTPEGFTGTMTMVGPELFFPLGVYDSLANDFMGGAERTLSRPDAHNLFLVARLPRTLDPPAAAGALALLSEGLARAFPAEHDRHAISLAPLPRFVTSTSPASETAVTTLGIVLLGMTGAVMLTVCLNLAAMLLARGRARRKEFAIRLALGGGRGRIVRQLLVEGLPLSLVGGALGMALGGYGIDVLMATLMRLLPVNIAFDGMASPALAAATLFFCLLSTLAFALGPALKHSRADILTDLKVQTGDDPAPRGLRFVPRNPLVAAQVALSLGLLIAAGLFVRMALGAASVDLGFRADDTVLAEVDSRLGGFDEAQSLDLYARVEQRLASLPGVEAASIGALVPMGLTSIGRSVRRAGTAPPPGSTPATPDEGRAFGAPWNAIGPSYFDAMGVRVLQGRTFTTVESYNKGAPPVAILDDNLARRLWPDGDALGQRIQWARDDDADAAQPATAMEVVGIVAPTRRELFENTPRGAVYVPFAQGFMSNAFFHVRPAAAVPGLVETVRTEIRAAAPGVPVFAVRPFDAHLSNAPEYWVLKASSSMFSFFGVMAMLVALVGIYGVTAYAVARRTREIGVRVAVGARPQTVVRMMVGESLGTTLAGVAGGWILGLGIGQVLASTFVDLAGFDLLIFAGVPVVFVLGALTATWLPARRATSVNPVTALRAE